MKIWAVSLLVLLGGLVPSTFALEVDHSQTVICIPDKAVDSVLSYYVNPGEHPFCMNGGICKENFAEDPEFPCDCPSGLTGPHCEFPEGDVPDCALNCYNGGTCQVGIKHSEESFFQSEEDLQYCICPHGYYGQRCEVEGKRCGNSHCFNGGSCVTIERDDGTITDHCDCNTAGTDLVSYAGRFCQSPSSSFCSRFADHNGKHFCVNGGTCRGNSHEGCDCPEGFTGSVCEFQAVEEGHHAACNLQCQNKGICRKGSKNLSVLSQFNINHEDGTVDHSHNDDFEHCVCPVGYVGLACEFRLDICPGSTHACMHGAECIPKQEIHSSRREYTCDCDRADEHGRSFAGKYCQFESTQFCTVDGLRPLDGTGAFCVNEGECRGFVDPGEPHPGCECKGDFEGDHCEYPIEWAVYSGSSSESSSRGAMAISLTLGCTLLILFIAVVIVYRRQKSRERAFVSKGNGHYKDRGFVDGMVGNASGNAKRNIPNNRSSQNPPTISDLGYMIDGVDEASSHEGPFVDDDAASSMMPNSIDSVGTGDSSNGSFSEDPRTGRAMLMKGVIDRGSI